jgi:hypothetical protein
MIEFFLRSGNEQQFAALTVEMNVAADFQTVSRISNPKNVPSAGETSTLSTRAPSGPWFAHSIIDSTMSAVPWTTASTAPPLRFRTKPHAPNRRAA